MDRICIIGLGYVGLPLAVEFSKHFEVIGFDINEKRVKELKGSTDSTNEVSKETLQKSKIHYTNSPEEIKKANFIVLTVPTPVTDENKPDLSYIKSAAEIVGKNISTGSIVVLESTVYPGTTEEVVAPIIERASGLKCGRDFKVGYSPERINPGDREHTVDRIVKIVAGMDKESTEKITAVYSKIIIAGVHQTKNIKTAEAAKVIENIQRDLNIALVNELSLIFRKMNIDTNEVLDAASTKWNFHNYRPGLVGGHCIPVDPYYLTHKALELGHIPKVILAGREINNYMPLHVAKIVANKVKKGRILVLGLTFKENVKDFRNTKAKDLILELKKLGFEVIAHEPLLGNSDVEKNFGVKNYLFENISEVDGVILAAPHTEFKDITLDKLKQKMKNPFLFDVKSFYNREEAEKKGFVYERL